MKILTDHEISATNLMPQAIEAIEKVFRAQADGNYTSPPRFYVENDNGSLVFTVGGYRREGVFGFRVYDTFNDPDSQRHEQIVASYDAATGKCRGLVTGHLIGAIRTGAIGGVAIRYLARQNATSLGLIGTGLQARTQLEAALLVRDLREIRVYSRDENSRSGFATEMEARLGCKVVPVCSAREAVEEADIVICATNSGQPVFDPDWIQPGTHITTLGPKFIGRNELPPEVVNLADHIVSDSIEQALSYPKPFFLPKHHQERMRNLSEWITQSNARRADESITLFCSVGLSGTEAIVADLALEN